MSAWSTPYLTVTDATGQRVDWMLPYPSLGDEIGCFELIRSLLAREPSSRHYRGDA